MGVRKRGKVWYVRFTDRAGREREFKASTDKREAEKMLAAVQTKEARAKLKIGGDEDNPRAPIADLVAEFVAWVAARRSPKHAKLVGARLAKILDAGLIERVGDLGLRRVETAIDRLRAGRSTQTIVHYTAAIKSFSRWLKKRGRVEVDPLNDLERPANPQADRRRERRSLTPDEVSRLLAATQDGPTVARLTGPERVFLYRLALGTGFRAGELASLRPIDFDLDERVVRLASSAAKDRKRANQPLGARLAADLRGWLATLPPTDPLFPELSSKRTAEILRGDLLAAGIDPVDARGLVVDFHALRTTFVTRAGEADPGVASRLARHSDPRLTWGVYHDPDHSRAQAAVDAAERAAG